MDSEQIIQKFVVDLESKDRSPSTIVAYKKDAEQLSTFLKKGNMSIEEAKTPDLQNYIKYLSEVKKYTPKTVSRKINTMKTFYTFMVEENIVDSNYAEPIEHPEFEVKPPRVLSAVEYKALRDTVRGNDRLYTMVELMLQTGMRIGEVSRLKDTDVKLDSQPPVIRIAPFASNPERFIELNEVAEKSIRQWLDTRPKYTVESDYLFATKSGRPVLVRNIRTSINRAFKKNDIDDATVNDIRNTFIVYQLSKGVNIEKIAETAGHQRITSTEKYMDLVPVKPKNKQNKLEVL